MKSRRRIATKRPMEGEIVQAQPGPLEGVMDHAMSSLGQKQTCAAQTPMSAFGQKPDSRSAAKHVPFGSIADMPTSLRCCAPSPKKHRHLSAFGHLTIFLALKANRASLHLRPENTQAALIYHAAQMIAGGTTFQTGEVCGTPFFSGGPGCKKRARVRFCGDKCRWTHHNNKKVRLKT